MSLAGLPRPLFASTGGHCSTGCLLLVPPDAGSRPALWVPPSSRACSCTAHSVASLHAGGARPLPCFHSCSSGTLQSPIAPTSGDSLGLHFSCATGSVPRGLVSTARPFAY